MPAGILYCPNCRKALSEKAQIAPPKLRVFSWGRVRQTVVCPDCGASIDLRKESAGDCDRTAARCLGIIAGSLAFGIVVIGAGGAWWGGLIAAGVVGLLTGKLAGIGPNNTRC